MEKIKDLSLSILSLFAVLMLLMPLNLTYAQAGCCSHHGGVTGCASTGYQQCQDGNVSPSCKCGGLTSTSKTKAASTKQSKTITKSTKTKSKPVEEAKSKPEKASTKGCCARHGGVGSCNKSTGFQMCKDGTSSPKCKCN